MTLCRLLIVIMTAFPFGMALADDEGVDALYDAALPDDAAFVRFLSFGQNESPDVFGIEVLPAAMQSQDYIVVRADQYDGLDAGQFLTVIPARNRSALIYEDAKRERRKVLVSLVNLNESDNISLQTSKGEVFLVQPLEALQVGHRLVNPVSVSLAVFDGVTVLGTPFDVQLRRGQDLTIIVKPDGSIERINSKLWKEEAN